jgi:tight adherence protein B
VTAIAAAFIGAIAYLGMGQLLGLVSLRAWPGRWRSRPGRPPAEARAATALLRSSRMIVKSAGLGAGGWLAGWALTGSAWIAAPPALYLATRHLRRRERRRHRELQEVRDAWPDGARHIVALLRSGRTVQASVIDLAQTGPEPLQRAFRGFPSLAAALGPVAALDTVRESLCDPTTDRIVEVLLVAHEIGGRAVPDVLDDLAAAISDDLKTLEEIDTANLEQRLNAHIVFALPWLVLGLLTSGAGVYRSFYQSRPGVTIVVIAAVLSTAGIGLASRLGREPLENRVLGAESCG